VGQVARTGQLSTRSGSGRGTGLFGVCNVPYDEDLANRIRELIASEPDVSEETMFGGLVFLVGGKMSVAVSGKGGLIVRIDPEETDALSQWDETSRMTPRRLSARRRASCPARFAGAGRW
jgi:hypothetical protein